MKQLGDDLFGDDPFGPVGKDPFAFEPGGVDPFAVPPGCVDDEPSDEEHERLIRLEIDGLEAACARHRGAGLIVTTAIRARRRLARCHACGWSGPPGDLRRARAGVPVDRE